MRRSAFVAPCVHEFVTLGKAPKQGSIFQSATEHCDKQLPETSIYKLLHRESHRLFADEMFTDLFLGTGRNCISPRILAVVMVLQRIEGLSDREAVDRFTFDARWKYAAGGLDADYPSFVHTVLVNMRARLRKSQRPDRIFEVVLNVARQAGFVGKRRVLDSTALYDAVATQDTITMIRSAIRGLLRVVSVALETEIRAVLQRDDDYVTPGKPACDWDDEPAREALINALVQDAYAILWLLDDRKVDGDIKQALSLLATVVGQDIEQREDGVFHIVRGVAPDRVISTVDPEARHGHKSSARGFDGYKGHISEDPDTEIITATAVTAGNAADSSVAVELLEEALAGEAETSAESSKVEVFGDTSYGTAAVVEHIEDKGGESNVKVQEPSARKGLYSKSDFAIDLDAGTVRCPRGVLVMIQPRADGAGNANFADHCADCPLRDRCTTSPHGRQVKIHPHERTLARKRAQQRDPVWKARYRATRPKVERKLAHLMRRRHGGRRARVRGVERVRSDFALLAAAANLRRLAMLQARPTPPVTSRVSP